MIPRPSLSIGFRASIALVLVSAVLLMAVATVGIVVFIGGDASRKNAEVRFGVTGSAVVQRLEDLLEAPMAQAEASMAEPEVSQPLAGSGRFDPWFSYLSGIVRTSPSIRSASVAGPGTLLQLVRTRRDPRVLAAFQAPPEAEYVLRTVVGAGRAGTRTDTFLADFLGRPLGQRTGPGTGFDSGWTEAASHGKLSLSPSSVPISGGSPAVVVSAPLRGNRVLGIEVALDGLQTFLDRLPLSSHGGVMVLDQLKRVMAQSVNFGRHPEWLVKSVIHPLAGQDIEIVLTAPPGDFDAEFRVMELSVLGVTALLLVLVLPLTLAFTRRLARIMTVLGDDVERVSRMDFSGEAPHGSRIREFDKLAHGFEKMKTTLASETKVLAEAQLKLRKIVETGIALSTEKDPNTLCQLILDTAKELTDADGGTLYLLNEAKTELTFAIMLNDTLGTRLGGTAGPSPKFTVPLYKEDGTENLQNVATHSFHKGKTINIADAYDESRFDFSGTKRFDEANGYRSKSFLTVPLIPMGGDVLGALQLINTRQAGRFTDDMQSFVEALSASAATAIYNNQLLKELEELFDAIIDIINGAIGRKSPYTGGHCERVPIIAEMLADAASAVKTGPLAGFRFPSNEARREFILGAKLHDVGKVTTPEYVVDKATKLETIYNRIHEIRTRFEVLYRDAVIRRHEAVMAGQKKADADRELAAYKAQLDEEWAFLAKTNLGGEFLSPDKVERIQAIGTRPWLRYFDDRLGLSWEEEYRLLQVEGPNAPKPTLPAPETLLADKPAHIFPRLTPFEQTYQGFGFKTPAPEALYNHGEIYNLSISRGTLTNEEHFKIKEHVMQSIFMLGQLPLPDALKRVPEIAGEHHETLVGTGYPYQKKAEDLSIESRILTVADIFEALTASDRPYKKAKTLSESVHVLSMFKKDQHIDADLFDLFLTSGVYLRYAEKYLKPEQIDKVDISQYVGTTVERG